MNENNLPVEIDFEYVPVINFSMQQNHVPVVRKLFIKNNSAQDLRNVFVEITADPGFAFAWTKQVDRIPKDEGVDFGHADITLSTKYLSELTERISGTFTLKITVEGVLIFSEAYRVGILAYDQWCGVSILPEMLSAFITPNHPEVPKIIKRASVILSGWTDNPSFDDYQSKNPDRVKKQMAAIYEAIAERQIIYCTAPASFEDSGQRIRILDTIFTQQMANCLDLSLLFASCLEAVGINPVVVIIKGHAFAGAWLVSDSFADSVNDDASLLTKRMAEGINEIALVETTSMNAGQQAAFDSAIRAAGNHFLKEDDFILFIDVKRTRFSGIRPLPLRVKTTDGWEVVEETVNRDSDSPEEITEYRKLEAVASIDISKQQMWERKLLDLSLRNNLLNLRISKNTIQLIAPHIDKLEDGLSAGDEFQVLQRPADWDNPLRSAGVYQSINSTDPIADLVKMELSQKRLRSYLSEAELAGSLISLYRSSRLSLEENGANTLYVALGLLTWYETPASERPRFAPILLLPVEIIRKTAHKGFIIRSREEDAIMNITLLEMIRQDFGITISGLETLPKDGNGIDVKLVFNIIRQAIMSQSKWDVEEQAFLGIFSFSKFIMWNDIHANADKLGRNKIVASLISGQIKWDAKTTANNSTALDSRYHPSEIALPISADSSQLEAICAADGGESFVLHGPPGTGKSQTITNIIANSLYKGKKVLFVAEKMAALSVVQHRLEAIGLVPFCLELHSNKSKKSAVLEQLKKALEVARKATPQQFSSEADRLYTLRAELNDYAAALHKTYSFGYSIYDIFSAYAQVADAPDVVRFADKAIADLTQVKLAKWNDLASELHTIGSLVIHPHNHPLAEVQLTQYTQSVKNETRSLLTAYIEDLRIYKACVSALLGKLNIDIVPGIRQHFIQLQIIIDLLSSLPDVPAAMVSLDNLERSLAQLGEIMTHGKKRDLLRDALLKKCNRDILTLNADALLHEWTEAGRKWFLPRILKQNSIKKSLRQLSLKHDISGADIPAVLHDIIAFRKEQEVIEHNAAYLAGVLGLYWQGGNCNWEKIELISGILVKLNREVVALFDNSRKAKQWRNEIAQELSEGRETFMSLYGKYFSDFTSIYFKVIQKENKLQELLRINLGALPPLSAHRIENCIQHAARWLDSIEQLRDWVAWQQIKEKAVTEGLSPLVTVYENGLVKSSEVVSAFKMGLFRSCADFIFSREPSLSSFNGKVFEDKIRRFREINKYFEQLTREELFAKLAARIPLATQEAAQSSEMGILQRAIRNGGRGMSIRKLFDAIANLLPRITPCMLMSPISVAQYFDAGTTKFDLVIFDEASQMPTCEAVGAIARGANVIIVGDPKQLPPTNFFVTNQVDEDNEKEDLESILDDCLALSMPERSLQWHYRSKHESLIAFSNAKYYENKLLTFPSPDDLASKVSHTHIPGYYDRSRSRQNEAEARAIVNEIIRRLSDPVLSMRSIGVVTFSSVQQTLIDDMLEEALKANPALDAAALAADEPVFIKNLENVQGDERDIILFSVGYGPDKEGKVNLNFGPLNREGGKRRLNVAISRARYEMHVFATLRSEQIDITRTSSEGVADLKAFLEYAEKGKAVLAYRNLAAASKPSGFVDAIAGQIGEHGYKANTNIGCSGYKIDIGVIDPENPGKYILGILCDGHAYREARTARDREIVQHDVLRLLGWNLHKLWSADWWENPDNVMKDLLNAIKRAEHGVPETAHEVKPKERLVLNNAVIAIETPVSPVLPAPDAERYTPCILPLMAASSADDFLLAANRRVVCNQINDVIAAEAPISKNLLCRRVLAAWGVARAGARINAYFEQLFAAMQLRKTEMDGSVFFWDKSQHPDLYKIFRTPGNEQEKRDAEDLPPDEVANAIKTLLTHQVSLPKEALVRETAKVFGFARIGNNVESSVLRGLAVAVARKYVSETNNRIVLNG